MTGSGGKFPDIVDRTVQEVMGGGVDLENNVWLIPAQQAGISRVEKDISKKVEVKVVKTNNRVAFSRVNGFRILKNNGRII